MSYEEQCFISV